MKVSQKGFEIENYIPLIIVGGLAIYLFYKLNKPITEITGTVSAITGTVEDLTKKTTEAVKTWFSEQGLPYQAGVKTRETLDDFVRKYFPTATGAGYEDATITPITPTTIAGLPLTTTPEYAVTRPTSNPSISNVSAGQLMIKYYVTGSGQQFGRTDFFVRTISVTYGTMYVPMDLIGGGLPLFDNPDDAIADYKRVAGMI